MQISAYSWQVSQQTRPGCSLQILSHRIPNHISRSLLTNLHHNLSQAGNKGVILHKPLYAVRTDQDTGTMDQKTLQMISDISKEAESKVAASVQESRVSGLDIKNKGPEIADFRKKLQASIDKLAQGLLERETEVRLLVLAGLAREHLLLLGPPGTAKSELSRRLSKLSGGVYFERLLTRFSVPEELFGPLSMKGLENDQYVRQIDGYLPTAEVAFIDEIFKANSAILNALLTILNERQFDNGTGRLNVPLLCLVGASNESPESEELDALYDRFLIRKNVAQVSQNQLFSLAKLASGQSIQDQLKEKASQNGVPMEQKVDAEPISMDEFKNTAKRAYKSVQVPDSVIDIFVGLRNYLQTKCEPPVYVSDRRFMKSINLLQVAAYAEGRTEMNEYDCLLLEHVFGNRQDDYRKVRQFILDTIASDPGLKQSELVFLGLFGRSQRILSEDQVQESDLIKMRQETQNLINLITLRQSSIANTLYGNYPELRSTLWQSQASTQQAAQTLTPQMEENITKVENLLKEAYILKGVVDQQDAPTGILERLLPRRYKQYQKGIQQK